MKLVCSLTFILFGSLFAPQVATAEEGFQFKVFPEAKRADAEVKQACLQAIRTTYTSKIMRSRARIIRPDGWPAWLRLEATLENGQECVCRGSSDYPYGNTIEGSCS